MNQISSEPFVIKMFILLSLPLPPSCEFAYSRALLRKIVFHQIGASRQEENESPLTLMTSSRRVNRLESNNKLGHRLGRGFNLSGLLLN